MAAELRAGVLEGVEGGIGEELAGVGNGEPVQGVPGGAPFWKGDGYTGAASVGLPFRPRSLLEVDLGLGAGFWGACGVDGQDLHCHPGLGACCPEGAGVLGWGGGRWT